MFLADNAPLAGKSNHLPFFKHKNPYVKTFTLPERLTMGMCLLNNNDNLNPSKEDKLDVRFFSHRRIAS